MWLFQIKPYNLHATENTLNMDIKFLTRSNYFCWKGTGIKKRECIFKNVPHDKSTSLYKLDMKVNILLLACIFRRNSSRLCRNFAGTLRINYLYEIVIVVDPDCYTLSLSRAYNVSSETYNHATCTTKINTRLFETW